MTLHYSIFSKKNYIQVDLNGAISQSDILAATQQLIDTPGYHNNISVIWVVTRADMSNLDLDALDQVASGIESIFKGQRTGATALVSEKPINIVTVELFKEIYKRTMVKVFDSFPKAEDWLLKQGQ